MQGGAQEFENEETRGGVLNLERVLSAVQKRLRLLAIIPLMTATLVGVIVWFIPNRFDAAAVIQIDPRQKSITNIESIIPDLKGDQPSIESEVEIVASKPIILKVISVLGLRNDPDFNSPTLLSRLMQKTGLSSSQPEAAARRAPPPPDPIAEIIKAGAPGHSKPERDEIAAAFLDKLKVTRIRNTLLLEIKYSARDATKAALIANTIAEVYLKDQVDAKNRASATASGMLEEKLEDMRRRVAEAERKVEQWKSQHNVFDAEGQVLSEKQLARIMEQTVVARTTTAEAKAKYEQVQKLAKAGDGGSAIADVLQSHTVRLLKEQLANTTRKAAELKTKYGPKHPDIIKINAEVAEAETQLQAEVDKLVSNLRNEFEVAEARERQLTVNLAQLKDQEALSKDAGVELKELEREAVSSKQLFEALLTRYKQTAETQGFQLPDARIVERADAPLFPASPKRKQMVTVAAAGGLILAIVLAVLLDVVTPGIARVEDVERVLEAAHLSSVPRAAAAGEPGLDPAKAVRLIVAEPSSVYADAIRNARRALDIKRMAPGPRIVLVASSMPGEGAETIASNLAHHYALTGTRVLLIDADLRRHPLTRQLAAARQTGLMDQLLAGRPAEGAILRDGLTGLNFLPACGQNQLAASIPELLSSPQMGTAMASLKPRFDVVVLSAPPLLPVIDGRILADYCDQIVFVMTWQKTPKQIAKKALKALGYNQRKVAGVVLNDVAQSELDDDLPAIASQGSGQPARGPVPRRAA